MDLVGGGVVGQVDAEFLVDGSSVGWAGVLEDVDESAEAVGDGSDLARGERSVVAAVGELRFDLVSFGAA